MGLRFRKSITLCKGVRINFGKNSTSLTLGQKGLHKTFSTTGKVTTSIGIPGTGVYWTDTKKITAKEKNISKKPSHLITNSKLETTTQDFVLDTSFNEEKNNREKIVYQANEITNQIFNESNIAPDEKIIWDEKKYKENQMVDYTLNQMDLEFDSLITINGVDNLETLNNCTLDTHTIYLDEKSLKEIYKTVDQKIYWDEIKDGYGATNYCLDLDKNKFCENIAEQIVNGNIDAYLQVIEQLTPLEDIQWFGSDFEFGTDKPNFIEVEFKIYPEGVLEKGSKDLYFGPYIEAVSLKIARDMFSLLPIEKVNVHALYSEKEVFFGTFTSKIIGTIDFNNAKLEDIMNCINYNLSL